LIRNPFVGQARSSWFNCFIKRDLRRAALFLWMTPFWAALSKALTAA